jgi:hypothetical protein
MEHLIQQTGFVAKDTTATFELMTTHTLPLLDTNGQQLADTHDRLAASVNASAAAVQQLDATYSDLAPKLPAIAGNLDAIHKASLSLMDTKGAAGLTGGPGGGTFGDIAQQAADLGKSAAIGYGDGWQKSLVDIQPEQALALQTNLQQLTDNTISPWNEGQYVVMRDAGAHMINNLGAGISGASGSATGAASHLGADIAAALQSGFGHPTLTFTIVGSGGGSGTTFFPGGGTSTPGTRPTLPVGTPPATAPPSANSFRSVAANAGGGSGGGATLSIGSITIIQQPGEDAGALADRLFPTILDRWDREMRKRGRR